MKISALEHRFKTIDEARAHIANTARTDSWVKDHLGVVYDRAYYFGEKRGFNYGVKIWLGTGAALGIAATLIIFAIVLGVTR